MTRVEAGVAQRLRLLRPAASRSSSASDREPRIGGEHLDEALEVAAQQRLAAGQADLLDAGRDEEARERG